MLPKSVLVTTGHASLLSGNLTESVSKFITINVSNPKNLSKVAKIWE